MSKTLILDNGSYTIKAGYSNSQTPELIPNYVFKSSTDVYVGGEVDSASDPGGLYRQSPFEKGYPVHMNIESKVWQSIFQSNEINVNASDTRLILTDPNYTLPALDVFSRELLFETYGFHSLLVTSAPILVGRKNFIETKNDFSLVIDCGHSFSHVIPFVRGKSIVEATTRVDVGGMVITNFLRKQLTNQVDLMNEFSIVNDIKEDCCYFVNNIVDEIKSYETNKKSSVIYLLPDYSLLSRGKIKSASDPATFNNLANVRLGESRAISPELLFKPSLAGINQVGLGDAIKKSCSKNLPYYGVGEHMMKNVICMGGTCAIPGFKDRLSNELQNAFELTDDKIQDKKSITVSNNPALDPFYSAQYLLENDPEFDESFVSKQEFAEHGIRIFDKKYALSTPKSWFKLLTENNQFIN